MASYVARVTTDVAIEAENAAEAWRLMRRLRIIPGQVAGARLPGSHDRDRVTYRTHVLATRYQLTPGTGTKETTP